MLIIVLSLQVLPQLFREKWRRRSLWLYAGVGQKWPGTRSLRPTWWPFNGRFWHCVLNRALDSFQSQTRAITWAPTPRKRTYSRYDLCPTGSSPFFNLCRWRGEAFSSALAGLKPLPRLSPAQGGGPCSSQVSQKYFYKEVGSGKGSLLLWDCAPVVSVNENVQGMYAVDITMCWSRGGAAATRGASAII